MLIAQIPDRFSYRKFHSIFENLASTELKLSNDYIYLEANWNDRPDGLEQLIFISKDFKYVYVFNEIYNITCENDDIMIEYAGRYLIDHVVYDESSDYENELHLHSGDKVFDFYNVDDLFDLGLREKLFNAVYRINKAA